MKEQQQQQQQQQTTKLHIIMLPWLAMGHLLPFFELAKRLALKNLQISFFSTPSNISRLPSIPQTLTPFLNFISCSLPSTIDNTTDLTSEADRPLLNQTYASFDQHLIAFLSDSSRTKTDWIIYDFAGTSWVPDLASRFNINSAFFCLFNAAALAFLSRAYDSDSPEKLTKADHIPFPTTVSFRPFEARQIFSLFPKKTESKARSSDLMLIRTCKEFEAKWVDLLSDNYCPVGFLPPSFDSSDSTDSWVRIRDWLDKREDSSVVYAAFGSEAKLTREEIGEIGLGLEQSGLPFIWVLRVGAPPQGFEERTAGRGLVCMGWVPQARLLAHRAVGGFLTHGGWNSAVEGLVAGAVMVVLAMMFEQGLNARHLVESGYAVEVERNGEDGCFCGEEIGRKLKMVMVEEEGDEVRKKARNGKRVFGGEDMQEKYVVEVVRKLWEKKHTYLTGGGGVGGEPGLEPPGPEFDSRCALS